MSPNLQGIIQHSSFLLIKALFFLKDWCNTTPVYFGCLLSAYDRVTPCVQAKNKPFYNWSMTWVMGLSLPKLLGMELSAISKSKLILEYFRMWGMIISKSINQSILWCENWGIKIKLRAATRFGGWRVGLHYPAVLGKLVISKLRGRVVGKGLTSGSC